MSDSQLNPDGSFDDMDYRRNVLAPALARVAKRARKVRYQQREEQVENARWQDGRIRPNKR
jgi:hypothetical protein